MKWNKNANGIEKLNGIDANQKFNNKNEINGIKL